MKGTLSFNFWIGEILLGAVIPIVLLQVERFRKNVNLRMLAMFLVVGGVVAYRWDINLSGQLVQLTYLAQDITARYTTYFPSLIEILAGAAWWLTVCLPSAWELNNLNVVYHPSAKETVQEEQSVSIMAPADQSH